MAHLVCGAGIQTHNLLDMCLLLVIDVKIVINY